VLSTTQGSAQERLTIETIHSPTSRSYRPAGLVYVRIMTFNEEDEDGQADSGPKHWHVFDVIARQPRVPN
jgi:hypothetical protein